MSAIATSDTLLTIEDLFSLPDDGKERWLIRGQLREKEMTRRNRFHARLEARITQLLGNWLDAQPHPRGEVFSGEVGIILSRNPDSSVGVDVAYVPHGVVISQTDETTMIEGAPTLVVEILSPNDTIDEINEKRTEYQSASVALIWLVDPYNETITVYELGMPPVMFNISQALSAEPQLPGFTVPVIRLFQR